jgi:hypothetical protein
MAQKHLMHKAGRVAPVRVDARCAALAPHRSTRVRRGRSLPPDRIAPPAAEPASSSSRTRPSPIRRPQSVSLRRLCGYALAYCLTARCGPEAKSVGGLHVPVIWYTTPTTSSIPSVPKRTARITNDHPHAISLNIQEYTRGLSSRGWSIIEEHHITRASECWTHKNHAQLQRFKMQTITAPAMKRFAGIF